jgi:hypothetical protein
VVLIDGGRVSQVAYAELKADRAALQVYLDAPGGVTPKDIASWDKHD